MSIIKIILPVASATIGLIVLFLALRWVFSRLEPILKPIFYEEWVDEAIDCRFVSWRQVDDEWAWVGVTEEEAKQDPDSCYQYALASSPKEIRRTKNLQDKPKSVYRREKRQWVGLVRPVVIVAVLAAILIAGGIWSWRNLRRFPPPAVQIALELHAPKEGYGHPPSERNSQTEVLHFPTSMSGELIWANQDREYDRAYAELYPDPEEMATPVPENPEISGEMEPIDDFSDQPPGWWILFHLPWIRK